jgi:hypothetical protein
VSQISRTEPTPIDPSFRAWSMTTIPIAIEISSVLVA